MTRTDILVNLARVANVKVEVLSDETILSKDLLMNRQNIITVLSSLGAKTSRNINFSAGVIMNLTVSDLMVLFEDKDQV